MFIRLTYRNSKKILNVAVDDISRYWEAFGSTYVCLKSSSSSTPIEVLETPYAIEKFIEEEQEEVFKESLLLAIIPWALTSPDAGKTPSMINSLIEDFIKYKNS